MPQDRYFLFSNACLKGAQSVVTVQRTLISINIRKESGVLTSTVKVKERQYASGLKSERIRRGAH